MVEESDHSSVGRKKILASGGRIIYQIREKGESMGEKKRVIPLEISLKDVDTEKLRKEVESRRGWCSIECHSGELDLGIFIATFEDDYKFVFEVDEPPTRIRLMLTCDQIDRIQVGDSYPEEMQQTLNTILRYYLWWKEEEHG